MRPLTALGAVVLTLTLAACATPALPPPSATLETLQAIRQANLPSLKVGAVVAAPGMPSRTLTVRAGSMAAPDGQTFAQYLQSTLEAELRAGGKLDPAARTEVTALLNESAVNSAIPTASARLGARFKVTVDGREVYSRSLHVDSQWRSSLLGDVAIPEAMNHYTELYARLVRAFVADPELARALAAGPRQGS